MKIVSGGQTGADRAALDVAKSLGMPYGGWIPKGGWAEDHPIPPGVLDRYPDLRETATGVPAERTRLNVQDSDATVVLVAESWETKSPGTALTCDVARQLGRPYLVVFVDRAGTEEVLRTWLLGLDDLKVLNVAGPRESELPGLYAQAYSLLKAVLA